MVLFHTYFWPRFWPQPQPPEIGLGLVALVSASRFWPRLTSLISYSFRDIDTFSYKIACFPHPTSV